MRIGICDDDKHMIEELKAMVRHYDTIKGLKTEVVVFFSGEELVSWCREAHQELQLLFLDIEMEGMSGLEAKERLRDVDLVKRIVFLTSHREAMPMAFGMKVVNFYEKPMAYETLEKVIDVVGRELGENRLIKYKIGSREHRISSDEIIYLGSEGDYTYFYIDKGERSPLIKCSMKEWETRLEGLAFSRIHKSYIVNLSYVADVRKEVFLNAQGMKLPLGRAYREKVREEYQQYILKIVRERLS